MDEPLKHLLRPLPPWETRALTHCGLPGAQARTTTVDELAAHIKKYGRQRSAFSHCMTCLDRLSAYTRIDMIARIREPVSWQNDPRAVTARWVERVRSEDDDDRMRRTLHAIGALVEAHRAEFDAMVDAAGVSDLARRRRHRGA